MGNPGYTVTDGEILLFGENIASWTPDVRARAGIFLAFQYPEAISGVSVIQFLRQAIAARKGLDELSVLEVRLDLAEWMDRLGIDSAFAERHLNDGFSGGERKRNEVLQMALLDPVRPRLV
jgi:Fe-S cluster assembly ATP-binding protein